MILKTLSLKHFRRFESLEIDFDERLTVIVARNGQGKTAILDAISVAYGTFVGAFDNGKSKHIDRSDARYTRQAKLTDTEQAFPVEISASFSQPDIYITRSLSGPKNRTTTKDADQITRVGRHLQAQTRAQESINLPAVAYYGSGRLWKTHKNMQRKSVLTESRTMGYEDCLSSASNFTQVQQWMAKAEMARLQEREMGKDSGIGARMSAVINTVNAVLADEGWGFFHYSLSHEELALNHEDLGSLPVSMLSDGVRAMVSMTADLAFRCARLNGHLGQDASQLTPGIALIDEVDLHLHPAWQQRVVASLQRAFPKIQFVVTTHSPQVLSTVRRESIRVVGPGATGEVVASTPLAGTYGQISSDVLESVMFVDPQPPIREREQLQRLTELVDQGLYDGDEAVKLFKSLTNNLGESHSQLQRLHRSKVRQQALKG